MGLSPFLGISGLLGGSIGAVGSEKAAQTQANAAEQAAQLQYSLGEQGLAFQKQQYGQNQANLAPWIQAGQGAVGSLSQLQQQALNGTGPLAPWTQQFQAPTAAQAAQYPGYQFQLQQGQQALQNSAAASGGLLSTGTAKNLDAYSQGLAQQDYGNVYNQALQQYQLGYNQYEQNQSNLFNRYASLAGLGQTSAATLGNQNTGLANSAAGTLLNTGAQVGQQYNNIGAATASGYVGATNSAAGGLGNLQQYLMLQQLLQGQNPGANSGLTSQDAASIFSGTNING